MSIPQISGVSSSIPLQPIEQHEESAGQVFSSGASQERQAPSVELKQEPTINVANPIEEEREAAGQSFSTATARTGELRVVSQRVLHHRQARMVLPDLFVEEEKKDETTEQEVGTAVQSSSFGNQRAVESKILRQRQVLPIASEMKQQNLGQQESLNSPYIEPEKISKFVKDSDLEGLRDELRQIIQRSQGFETIQGPVTINTLFRVYELRSLNPAPQGLGEFISHLKKEIETIMQEGTEEAKKSLTTELEKELYSANAEMRSLALKIHYLAKSFWGRFRYHFADSYGHCDRTSKASTVSLAGITGTVTSVVGLSVVQPSTSAFNASIVGLLFSLTVGLFPIGYLAVKAYRKEM